ncbi:unnamed protein product [Penicillium glandicola]
MGHVTLNRQSGTGDDLESIDRDPFDTVLKRVKVQHIGKYVVVIRAKTQLGDKNNIPIVEVGTHTCISEHMCYKVTFSDGVSWLLKVPAIGTPDQFDENDAEGLLSEALTMIMLRCETTIPTPGVFSYNNTCENELKVPFILMEFIDARPLEGVWHDQESPKEFVQSRRTRCLQDIAAAAALRFDDQDCIIGVVPVNNDPFSGLKDTCTFRLNRWGEQQDAFSSGCLKLFRMSVDWIPESTGESFVLSHPNPNIFNFLVAEDGSVRAILDWHGTTAELPSIGNETYPLWLMRDWDPTVYRWNEEMEHRIHDEDCFWEDSPDSLEFNRNVYAQCIANLRPESENSKVTRNSPLFQHLMMAAGDSMFALGITEKILCDVVKQVKKNADDNSWPFNPSNNNKKDDSDSKNHSSSKEGDEDTTGDHNSLNETKGKVEHGGEDKDEYFDIYEILEALDKDGQSGHQQKLLKTAFDYLVII